MHPDFIEFSDDNDDANDKDASSMLHSDCGRIMPQYDGVGDELDEDESATHYCRQQLQHQQQHQQMMMLLPGGHLATPAGQRELFKPHQLPIPSVPRTSFASLGLVGPNSGILSAEMAETIDTDHNASNGQDEEEEDDDVDEDDAAFAAIYADYFDESDEEDIVDPALTRDPTDHGSEYGWPILSGNRKRPAPNTPFLNIVS
ncbi:unnamed protein product [Protopolystoma xenopodis]|uniref:Uncharacterized protein n=1 Tax=Protopolystoma xenopodis TaxID=117903 RepID=A0A3S5CFZ2_9PLAT|nr:unnamed protein product [Protopolystoma xenopodis]